MVRSSACALPAAHAATSRRGPLRRRRPVRPAPPVHLVGCTHVYFGPRRHLPSGGLHRRAPYPGAGRTDRRSGPAALGRVGRTSQFRGTAAGRRGSASGSRPVKAPDVDGERVPSVRPQDSGLAEVVSRPVTFIRSDPGPVPPVNSRVLVLGRSSATCVLPGQRSVQRICAHNPLGRGFEPHPPHR